MKKTIADFLWFVEERNNIQQKKKAGLLRPWTTDRILDETKFTCLDRNDDYGTKSLFAFVDGMDVFSTIFYVVYFRSFYSLRTFIPQMTGKWIVDYEDIKDYGLKAGCRMPYQIYLKNDQNISNFLTTTAFDVVEKLYQVLPSFKSVSIEDAAEQIAKFFKDTHGMRQIFLGSEIAKDISSLYPLKIDPNSWCPFNVGAKKGLNLLPRGNWKHKAQLLVHITGMTPSKTEHALCEWAKYVKREAYLAEGNSKFPKSWIYSPSKKVFKFVSPWNNYQFKNAV
ncbi:MAG: putative DNA base hypermodification protein [Sphaerochaetaceae bacterium]|nr:putative DNA base hypermodification protein [Sphaerochaetaceae bacterium]